jgi:hypothetical protein
MQETTLPLHRYFDMDKRLVFALLCVYYILFSYLWKELLFTDDVYYNTYAEQISLERIERYINIQRKVQWVAYIIMPLIILCKTSLVAICLNVGTLFAGYKIPFGKLFRIAAIAEGVFVLSSFVRMMWLYFVVQPSTIQEIKLFYPLSLLSFFSSGTVESWLMYPLQTINIFELTYWAVLALGMKWVLNEKFGRSFSLVMSSYGVGLLLWGLFITFLSITYS